MKNPCFLFFSLTSFSLKANTFEKPSNSKHSTTSPIVYAEPKQKGEFESIADVEHYFRAGVAECESLNCKKEILCLKELKSVIKTSIQNLYRTKTQKISKMKIKEKEEIHSGC